MWANAGVESWAMCKTLARSRSFQFSGAMSATGTSPEAATLVDDRVDAPAQGVVSGDRDALAGEMPADGGADPQDVAKDPSRSDVSPLLPVDVSPTVAVGTARVGGARPASRRGGPDRPSQARFELWLARVNGSAPAGSHR